MRPMCLILGAVAILIAGCGGDDEKSGDAASTPAAANTTEAARAAAASNDVTVSSTEFAFDPSEITAKAGKVKITLKNDGQAEHELVVLKTDTPADQLKVSGGRGSEDDSVGEIAEIAAGATDSSSFDLKAGTYVYVCNITGHYQGGMRGTITVE